MSSQKVMVAGAGVSGIASAKLLLALGGEVVLYDGNAQRSKEELKEKCGGSDKLTVVLGELKRRDLHEVELCIISPGIPLDSPMVALLDEAKIPVWGEIQLAFHCAKGRLAAITGTNGKTTTTALAGQIMKDYFSQVFVVGNIGIPYTEIALETEDESVTVAEVSSFQLETIMDFRPQVSAILNITPDHLDRHKTMECYIGIKKCIAMNQKEEDTIVLNYEDPVLRRFGLKGAEEGMELREENGDPAEEKREVQGEQKDLEKQENQAKTDPVTTEIVKPDKVKTGNAGTDKTETDNAGTDKAGTDKADPEIFGENLKAKVVFFSSRRALKEGIFLEGGIIYWNHNGKKRRVIRTDELQLLGRHNYENVMAAVAVGLSMGVPLSSIQKTIVEFKAVEHRIEFVRERSGVKYYNDSKGTNPDAAIQAIRAMPGPTILIAGGYDKHNTYDEWIEEFAGKVKYLVLIGQTRDKIAQCAREHGFHDIMYAEDMPEAVSVCASYADRGDYVLLSPACASWGMFKNYEERGRIFKECVLGL